MKRSYISHSNSFEARQHVTSHTRRNNKLYDYYYLYNYNVTLRHVGQMDFRFSDTVNTIIDGVLVQGMEMQKAGQPVWANLSHCSVASTV